jgi:hypothetical protein
MSFPFSIGGLLGSRGNLQHVFIFTGESNSGGRAPNASATGGELASRSQVQMFNVNTNVFQNLDIGTNNNLDHAGLNSTEHGIELEIANLVAAGRFSQSQVYVIQTGQGGDTIDTWATGFATNYWTKWLARVNAAKALFSAAGITPIYTVFYSQGINDAINFSTSGLGTGYTTNTAGWKTATIAHIAKIRGELGATTKIVMTKFRDAVYSAYNTRIDEIVAADSYTKAIQTRENSGNVEWQVDGNHWTYLGYKSLANLFVDEVLSGYGQTATPSYSPAGGAYGGAQTVTITGNGTVKYTSNNRDPNIGTAYSGSFAASPPITLEARAWETNKKSSAIGSVLYTLNAAVWGDKGTSIILSNGNQDAQGGAAWNLVRANGSGKSSGKWYFEVHVITQSNAGSIAPGFADGTAATGASMNGTALANSGATRDDGFNFGSGVTNSGSYGIGTTTAGDIIGVHLDLDNRRSFYSLNGAYVGSGDPSVGSNPRHTWGTSWTVWPACYLNISGQKVRLVTAGCTYPPDDGFSEYGA